MVVLASALVLVALPFFMVGGLAVQVKAELGIDEAAFGVAVTIGFLTGAVCTAFAGRVADRIGAHAAVYLGAAIAVAALLSLGLLTRSWAGLVLSLSLAGVGVSVTDPGLAVLVSRAIPPARQGLAFGIKEGSIPAATLVAGLAVPAIALTVGWRWAFALGLLPLALILVLLPRVEIGRRPEPHGDTEPTVALPHWRALSLAAVAAALGTAAGSGAGIFLTDSAVAMGMSPANAGLLLASGSLAGIATRVGTGLAADRLGGPQFKVISVMLAIGAVTMATAGTGDTGLLVLAALGAFTGAWAWTGLFFLSLVRTSPHRPGTVAGIGSAGLGLGNAAGPLLFGVVAGTSSYEVAWVAAAVIAAIGALLMSAASSRF